MKESCFKGCFCSKAFTLVELLVVVLIISVLAAVAVPQYKKAVTKHKLIPIIVASRTIRNGLRLFMLESGRLPNEAKELDIWDSVDEEKNAYYLQGKRYYWSGSGRYVRTYFPGNLTCDFPLYSAPGRNFCSTNNQTTIALLKEIGWKVQKEINSYTYFYIPGAEKQITTP